MTRRTRHALPPLTVSTLEVDLRAGGIYPADMEGCEVVAPTPDRMAAALAEWEGWSEP